METPASDSHSTKGHIYNCVYVPVKCCYCLPDDIPWKEWYRLFFRRSVMPPGSSSRIMKWMISPHELVSSHVAKQDSSKSYLDCECNAFLAMALWHNLDSGLDEPRQLDEGRPITDKLRCWFGNSEWRPNEYKPGKIRDGWWLIRQWRQWTGWRREPLAGFSSYQAIDQLHLLVLHVFIRWL